MCNKGSVHPSACWQSDLSWWDGRAPAWVNIYYDQRGHSSFKFNSNMWIVFTDRRKPSLPSATASRACQFILIIRIVHVCGHPDVHAGHMLQKHVLARVLPLPWALKSTCIVSASHVLQCTHSRALVPPSGHHESQRDGVELTRLFLQVIWNETI